MTLTAFILLGLAGVGLLGLAYVLRRFFGL